MLSFSPEDRQALVRGVRAREAATELVNALHHAIPRLFAARPDFRLSKVREDSDRVGVFFFLPRLGNVWCGVMLKGAEALQLKLEYRAEAVTPFHDRLVQGGMAFEPPHYAGRMELVGRPGPSLVEDALAEVQRWVGLCE